MPTLLLRTKEENVSTWSSFPVDHAVRLAQVHHIRNANYVSRPEAPLRSARVDFRKLLEDRDAINQTPTIKLASFVAARDGAVAVKAMDESW